MSSWCWINSFVFTQTKLFLTGQWGISLCLAGEAVCTDERFSTRNVQSGGIYAKFTVFSVDSVKLKNVNSILKSDHPKYKQSICSFYRKKKPKAQEPWHVCHFEQNMVTRFTLIFSASAHYERILYNPEVDSRLLYQLLKGQVDMKSQMILAILKSL